jgi:hypothetical protein
LPDPQKLKEEGRSEPSDSIYYDEGDDAEKLPILSVAEIPTLRSLYRSRKLQQHDQKYTPDDAYNQVISFTFYDITRLRVGAIVNSANRRMSVSMFGDSLNYYIHRAAGPGLRRECQSLGRVKTGSVKMTSGHKLPATYVLHAARPQYDHSATKNG